MPFDETAGLSIKSFEQGPWMKRIFVACCLFFVLGLTISTCLAQQSTTPATQASATSAPDNSRVVNEKLAQLDQKVTTAQSSADNAWMLVCAALVLMMTGPRLGLVLWWLGPPQKHLSHHDAKFCADGAHHRALGFGRL